MYIKRIKIDQLTKDMIKWRDLAHANYEAVLAVQDAYITKARDTGQSVIDAQARAAKDVRFVTGVANNQMYDRFATRDAAVLTALASLVNADLLDVQGASAYLRGPSEKA